MELIRWVLSFAIAAAGALLFAAILTMLWPRHGFAATSPDIEIKPGPTLWTLVMVQCSVMAPSRYGCIASTAPVLWTTERDCQGVAESTRRMLGGSGVLLAEATCLRFETP